MDGANGIVCGAAPACFGQAFASYFGTMKLNSKYFDGIRVKPDQDRLAREKHAECDWQGCTKPGLHRAPRGRGREGQYFNFCLEHVRQYNKSYNYFDGMSDDEVATYQKADVTGHRPTWSVGGKGAANGGRANPTGGFQHGFTAADPLGLFGMDADPGTADAQARFRTVGNVERKSLEALGLDPTATKPQIKARFKELVKRHHPDANQDGSGSEEKLREVIQAYNYLKRTGLC